MSGGTARAGVCFPTMGRMPPWTSPARTRRRHRPLLALLALLLVLPLQALGAAPAHAATFPMPGIVTDGEGTPIPGVTAYLYEAGHPGAPDDSYAASDSTLAEGDFEFPLVEEGHHYDLYLDGPAGYLDQWLDGASAAESPDVWVDEAGVWVEGADEAVPALEALLQSTATHDVSGTVTDDLGAGLAGIDVTAYSADGGSEADTATSGATGDYTLQLSEGAYHLRYVDPGGDFLPTWYGGVEPLDVMVSPSGAVTVDEETPCPGLCDVALAPNVEGTEFPVSGSVVDALGEPVDGLTVDLLPEPGTTDSGTTSTAAGGGFSVSVLPGSYRVRFSGTGWVDTFYGVDGQPETVTVTDSGRVLGETVVPSVARAVTGVVTAADGGAPVEGITVRAYVAGDLEAGPVDTAGPTTGTGGYTLDLPVGAYAVEFTDGDPAGGLYDTAWLDGASAVEVGQGGTVRVGETTGATIPDVPLTLSSADTAYPLLGDVSDANGDPIDGIVVTADPTGSTPAGHEDTSTTGAGDLEDGAYALALKPGTYEIRFEGGTAFHDATYADDEGTTLPVTVELGGTVLIGGVEDVDRLLDTVVLAGTAAYPLNGTVTNGTNGIGGITVRVHDAADTLVASTQTSTASGQVGRYALTLPIGSYRLEFVDEDEATPAWVTTWWPGVAIGDADEVRIDQAGQASVDGVAVPANDLAAVTMTQATADTTYDVAGEVVDNAGDPLDGVTVTALPVNGTSAANQVGGTTGADPATGEGSLGDHGIYRIGLKPGYYELRFTLAGYPTVYYLDPEGELGTERARIQVLAGGTVRIHTTDVPGGILDPVTMVDSTTTHDVAGRVLDEGDDPIAGITVQAIPDGASTPVASVTTAADGTYTLEVPVGLYTLRYADLDPAAPTWIARSLTGAGGMPAMVKVARGGQVSVDDTPVGSIPDVAMAQASEDTTYDLKGRVYDERYEPLDGATVVVLPAGTTDESKQKGSAVTGADPVTGDGSLGDAGVYRIAVKPGKYWLKYRMAGKATVWFNNGEDAGPSTVTVGPDGTISVPGLELFDNTLDDVQLPLPAVVPAKAPSLTGTAVVAKTVTVDVGTWRRPEDNGAFVPHRDYMYVEWFLDGRPADDWATGYYGQNFKVPEAAGGKKLTFRLSIDDPSDEVSRATALFTSRAVAVPKAPSSVAAVLKKGKLTVTVKVPTQPRPTGTIQVLAGKKVIAKGRLVAKQKGVAVLPLKLKKGKHKLTIVYSGTKTTLGAKKVVKVKA